MNTESTGGSSSDVSGHGLMFALHLRRQLKSTSKLIQLLRDDQSTLIKNIHCVKPLQTLIQVYGFLYNYICRYMYQLASFPGPVISCSLVCIQYNATKKKKKKKKEGSLGMRLHIYTLESNCTCSHSLLSTTSLTEMLVISISSVKSFFFYLLSMLLPLVCTYSCCELFMSKSWKSYIWD